MPEQEARALHQRMLDAKNTIADAPSTATKDEKK